ncbi:MAG: ABC transporter substrate-binding protein [Devosia sp.]
MNSKFLATAGLIILGLTTPAAALDCEQGYRAFLHHGGEDCIPENPQRIVTLHDQSGLLPLLELGVRPIGSAGALAKDGTEYFRRLSGYDTSDVEWLGLYGEPDREAVAALEPDLIFTTGNPQGNRELYGSIAPVVVIDMQKYPLDEALRMFAEAVNKQGEAAALEAEFRSKAAEVRTQLGERLGTTTVSILKYWTDRGTGFEIQDASSVMGMILAELPLVRPAEESALRPGDSTERSWETLGNHNADVIFHLHYDNDDLNAPSHHDAFKALDLVKALPVAQAGQIFPLDGAAMVGSSWRKATNGLEQISAVLLREDLNRDVVQE